MSSLNPGVQLMRNGRDLGEGRLTQVGVATVAVVGPELGEEAAHPPPNRRRLRRRRRGELAGEAELAEDEVAQAGDVQLNQALVRGGAEVGGVKEAGTVSWSDASRWALRRWRRAREGAEGKTSRSRLSLRSPSVSSSSSGRLSWASSSAFVVAASR